MCNTLIVIVNYRTANLVADCLASLAAERPVEHGYQVVVVDNNSGDRSVDHLRGVIAENGWDAWARVDARTDNDGFAAGNNAAIRPALDWNPIPDYFLLLNPDTIVRPGAVEELIRFAEAHPEVGIAGSRLEDPDGTPQRSAFRFPGMISEFERAIRLGFVSRLTSAYLVAPPVSDVPIRTDWVAGASMLVRREVFQSIGLMDEKYFLYFEEVDFCRRAGRAGFQCWYVPASHVVHLVGQSSGIGAKNTMPRRVPTYWFDSRQRYFEVNEGRLYARFADIAWMAGHALFQVRRFLERKADDQPPFLFRDFLRHHFLAHGGRA